MGFKRVRIEQPKDGQNKICTRCREQKPLGDFPKNGDQRRSQCYPCDRERQKNHRIANPERKRKYRLSRDYNWTQEEFLAQLAAQENRCAVCRTNDPGEKGWSIDHDHACCPKNAISCGKCIRGVVCIGCNNGMGCFKDNSDFLRKAADYLDAYRTKQAASLPWDEEDEELLAASMRDMAGDLALTGD